MNIVIGSGPSGIACTQSLLQKGETVLLIDGGIDLEEKTKQAVQKLSQQSPAEWPTETLQGFKSRFKTDAKGVQLKYIYGSDFPYQDVDTLIPREMREIGHLTPSLATGGFSNVWGAAMLPYTEKDIADWPLKVADLAPYYRQILSTIFYSAKEDDLAQIFPLYAESSAALNLSKQGELALNNLKKNAPALADKGFRFGHARLAVKARGHSTKDCAYCGLCLFGCPYDLIFAARHLLAKFRENPRFTHRQGVLIRKITESGGEVLLDGVDLRSGEAVALRAPRVFLGAGTVSSTKLLLNSLEIYDKPIDMKVSEYFLIPLLQWARAKNVTQEKLHTLAQLFLEVIDPQISDHIVHMQLYSYSELFRMTLERVYKLIGPLSKLVDSQFLGRLMVIQGYLHSAESSKIRIVLPKENSLPMQLEGVKNSAARMRINKVVMKLLRLSGKTKMLPLLPMLQVGKPGEGRHAGGTFPMSLEKKEFSSDLAGRPAGFSNVHLIDSSNFPSVPAPTITLTAMANAARIVNTVY